MLAGYPATKLTSEIKFQKHFNVVVLPMHGESCLHFNFHTEIPKITRVIGVQSEVGKFYQCDSFKSRTGSINFFYC